jgi:hypothetical protein
VLCLLESSPGPASAETACGSESGAPNTKTGLGVETGTMSAKPCFDVEAGMMFLEMSPSKMALVMCGEVAFF